MKRVVLIDEIMVRDGFATRSEFLRFLIVTYFKQNGIARGTPVYEERDDPKNERTSDQTGENAPELKVFEMRGGRRYYYGHPEEDFEFGIPKDVIDEIWKEVQTEKSLAENTPRPQS